MNQQPHSTAPRKTAVLAVYLAAGLLATVMLPQGAKAADAHTAVQAKPGEIVLLRDVPTRPAVRVASPGLALIVDPTPNDQLGAGLAAIELSDSETAAIGAPVQHATAVLGAALAGGAPLAPRGGTNPGSTPRETTPQASPLGAVGGATRGVGSQITNALRAFPLGKAGG